MRKDCLLFRRQSGRSVENQSRNEHTNFAAIACATNLQLLRAAFIGGSPGGGSHGFIRWR